MPPVIELDGLAKRYGSVVALAELRANIDGTIIGLLGPNGAGKSTLLRCLLGLIPFAGEARVLGRSSARDGDAIRDRVGYMPEYDVGFAGSTAIELCTYVAELSGLPRGEAIQRGHAALALAGLEDKRYQPIAIYSTGQKQRVKLAQALVHDPDLLFLDEPTAGLDPRARDEMLALIAELPRRRGCAIVLSTHLLPDAEQVCDRAIVLDRGQLRFAGSIAELRRGAHAGDADGTFAKIRVKADAARLHAALVANRATCELISPVELAVRLAGDLTTELIFRTAIASAVQIRAIEPQLASVEAAFLALVQPERAEAAP